MTSSDNTNPSSGPIPRLSYTPTPEWLANVSAWLDQVEAGAPKTPQALRRQAVDINGDLQRLASSCSPDERPAVLALTNRLLSVLFDVTTVTEDQTIVR
jgi:hypothetical protein